MEGCEVELQERPLGSIEALMSGGRRGLQTYVYGKFATSGCRKIASGVFHSCRVAGESK